MSEAKEFYREIGAKMEKVKKGAPAMVAGFGGLFSKVMAEGAISLREKELIALGIAVAVNCVPCIRAHVKKCLEAGASKEQILEGAAVAVVMGGGPAYMHTAEVIDALEALEK
jgi:AhpD family alkylhydroperoxidase